MQPAWSSVGGSSGEPKGEGGRLRLLPGLGSCQQMSLCDIPLPVPCSSFRDAAISWQRLGEGALAEAWLNQPGFQIGQEGLASHTRPLLLKQGLCGLERCLKIWGCFQKCSRWVQPPLLLDSEFPSVPQTSRCEEVQ